MVLAHVKLWGERWLYRCEARESTIETEKLKKSIFSHCIIPRVITSDIEPESSMGFNV